MASPSHLASAPSIETTGILAAQLQESSQRSLLVFQTPAHPSGSHSLPKNKGSSVCVAQCHHEQSSCSLIATCLPPSSHLQLHRLCCYEARMHPPRALGYVFLFLALLVTPAVHLGYRTTTSERKQLWELRLCGTELQARQAELAHSADHSCRMELA